MKYDTPKTMTAWIYLGLLVLVGIGFFIPVSKDIWLGFMGKGFLFIVVMIAGYFLYVNARNRLNGRTDTQQVKQALEGDDSIQALGFGDAFEGVTLDLLKIIRSTLVGTVVGFYLIKNNGSFLEIGETENRLIRGPLPVQTGDLADMVLQTGRTVLEGNVNPAHFPALPDMAIRSFVGVPLYRGERLLGVLAMGSDAVESFGRSHQDFLQRCGDILIQMMSVCHAGLNEEMKNRFHQILDELESNLMEAETVEEAAVLFSGILKRVISFDRFSLSLIKEGKGWVQFSDGISDGMGLGVPFPLDEGLNGWVMKRNQPLLIENIVEGNFIRPRYYQNENQSHGIHTFMGFPLGSEEKAWGCVSIESRNPNQFGKRQKELVERFVIPFQLTLERIALVNQIKGTGKSPVIVDGLMK
ncbi:MAG TPA: GAF domain-containing protein [bacterium]|nr:GAF domain-containing protein [bacterium]